MSKITNYSSPFQSLHNKTQNYSITFPPNSRWTKQSFRDECDINTIMARYMATGQVPDLQTRAPQYLDVTEGFDFQSMQNQIVEARNLFMELPSVLRARFANDPAEFLAYVRDPENIPEMTKLGLIQSARGAGPGAPISSAPQPSVIPTSPQSTSPPTDNPKPDQKKA